MQSGINHTAASMQSGINHTGASMQSGINHRCFISFPHPTLSTHQGLLVIKVIISTDTQIAFRAISTLMDYPISILPSSISTDPEKLASVGTVSVMDS